MDVDTRQRVRIFLQDVLEGAKIKEDLTKLRLKVEKSVQ